MGWSVELRILAQQALHQARYPPETQCITNIHQHFISTDVAEAQATFCEQNGRQDHASLPQQMKQGKRLGIGEFKFHSARKM